MICVHGSPIHTSHLRLSSNSQYGLQRLSSSSHMCRLTFAGLYLHFAATFFLNLPSYGFPTVPNPYSRPQYLPTAVALT
jgi:hypothetical protein